MKYFINILSICCVLSHWVYAQDYNYNVLRLAKKLVNASNEENWSYSGSDGGGYVFKTEVDLIGDATQETLLAFSLEKNPRYHIFYGADEKYIGALGMSVIHNYLQRDGDKTKIWGVSNGHNYVTKDEEAFTKKVLLTEVSPDGVTQTSRIVKIGLGDVDDERFNQIKYHPETIENSFIPNSVIQYTTLEDFLRENTTWSEYNRSNWISLNGFRLKATDVKQPHEEAASRHRFDMIAAKKILAAKLSVEQKVIARHPTKNDSAKKDHEDQSTDNNPSLSTTPPTYYVVVILLLALLGAWRFLRKFSK